MQHACHNSVVLSGLYLTIGKGGNVGAVWRHPGDGGKSEVVHSHSWGNANVEWSSQVEVDHVVRADGHVVVAMIARHAQARKNSSWC